jgi:hypothetical protein
MAQYVVGLDSSEKRIGVWKTTGDPTTLSNWSAQDDWYEVVNRIYSLWAVQDGTTIHIVAQTKWGQAYYRSFSTSTDTWGSEAISSVLDGRATDTDVFYTPNLGVSVGVRSDGDIILLQTYLASDGDYEVRYAVNTGAGFPSTNIVNAQAADDNVAGSIVMGASDRAHFFYFNISDADVMHRSLSSADSLDTEAVADSSPTAAIRHSAGRGVSYVDNENTVVKVPYQDLSAYISSLRLNSGANPTINIDADISENSVKVINDTPIHCFALDGTDTWLLYSQQTFEDIFSDKQVDGGSWGTDTEEQDAVTANRISAGVYTRSGTKLGYVWLDGTTVSYDEKNLDPTFAAIDLSDMKFPDMNLYVGPFGT